MKVIVSGWLKEPEKYGRDAEAMDVQFELFPEKVAIQVGDVVVTIDRTDFEALQRACSGRP